jgi:hypothetical protein
MADSSIRKLQWELVKGWSEPDVTVWFSDSDEAWSLREFREGTSTNSLLVLLNGRLNDLVRAADDVLALGAKVQYGGPEVGGADW